MPTVDLRLPKDFFARDTIDVARALLGQNLVHVLPDGKRLVGRIVETEAYLGAEDPAAHSFGGRRTERTEAMFKPAGFSYVYFIYGMYFCLNVVTADEGVPEAVLIRAVEPRLGFASDDPRTTNGPGKLCRAMGITRAQNGLDLTRDRTLYIERGAATNDAILDGPRVGIGDRHDAVHWPLRFGLRDSPALSKPAFPPPP